MRTEGLKAGLLSALVIASFMVPAISLLSVSPSSAAPEGLTPRAPIYIDGNAGFSPENGVNGGGSGTENDPYIMENWVISAENTRGIEIRNTTAYFVVRNCVVENGWGAYYDGIYLVNVVNGRVESNTCENNRYYGIRLISSSNTVLENNTCENNWGAGISLYKSSNNTISNNLAENNEQYGIHIRESDNNTLDNNYLNNIYHGISLYISCKNNILNNTFENHAWYGIHLYNSDNNLIYHNNFRNNENQAYDNGINYWDNGYPFGGNYWSDYTGADNYRGDRETLMPGGDGIGDTPYYIPGDNNRDRYPLMSFFPPWTGWAVFGVLYQPPPGPIGRICRLKNLYAARLEKNIILYRGSKLVMRFYTYEGEYENESVIENFTPPWHVKENEVVPHPGNISVKKARLDLTYDNTENVISTLASWTTGRGDLIKRISQIKLEWSFASPAEKGALIGEISDIKGLWLWAPS